MKKVLVVVYFVMFCLTAVPLFAGLTFDDFKQNSKISELIIRENMDLTLSQEQAIAQYGLDSKGFVSLYNSQYFTKEGLDIKPRKSGGYRAEFNDQGNMMDLTKCVEYIHPTIDSHDIDVIQERFILKYGRDGLHDCSHGLICYYIMHSGRYIMLRVSMNVDSIEYMIADETDYVKESDATINRLKDKYK